MECLMMYPDTVNLPFNATVLATAFVRGAPGIELPGRDARFAVIKGNALVVEKSDAGYLLPRQLPGGWLKPGREPLFLGRLNDEPVFAFLIGKEDLVEPPYAVEPFNTFQDLLDDELLTIGGLANQALYWEAGSRLCTRCGSGTEWIAGSWGKQCSTCSSERYPAIHPCAIVLVKRGDEFLLIRKPEWPQGRYSLVAGFLDFGESLEECAVREVREETGIEVVNLHYVGSQNWPFPSQLMAGFVAEYAGGEIVVETGEIEDARWFSPRNLPAGFPPHRSIARWIIERHALSSY